jgi:hypothetical protein
VNDNDMIRMDIYPPDDDMDEDADELDDVDTDCA